MITRLNITESKVGEANYLGQILGLKHYKITNSGIRFVGLLLMVWPKGVKINDMKQKYIVTSVCGWPDDL